MQIFNTVASVQNNQVKNNYKKNSPNSNSHPSFGNIFSAKSGGKIGPNGIKSMLDTCVDAFLQQGEKILLTMDTKGGGHVACPNELDSKVAKAIQYSLGEDAKHVEVIKYDIFDPSNEKVPQNVRRDLDAYLNMVPNTGEIATKHIVDAAFKQGDFTKLTDATINNFTFNANKKDPFSGDSFFITG